MSEPTTAAEAMAEVCRKFCAKDQHDPACRLLREETLRADGAELALRSARHKLAEVLAMADWLERDFGDGGVKANIVASAIRRATRGIEFAP